MGCLLLPKVCVGVWVLNCLSGLPLVELGYSTVAETPSELFKERVAVTDLWVVFSVCFQVPTDWRRSSQDACYEWQQAEERVFTLMTIRRIQVYNQRDTVSHARLIEF